MKKIKSIIIDDEPGNIVTLNELLKEYCPQVAVLGTAQNPIEGTELIAKTKPEIVFLDIEMPYGNAFDMLDKMAPVNFEIIFVTAFNEYAIRAIKYAALDYLLKPINIPELKDAVGRVISKFDGRKNNSRVSNLLTNLKKGDIEKIGLPTKEGLYFEKLTNIILLEAEGSYTNVYLRNGVQEIVSRALSYFDEILPESIFCRVHNSYIINVNSVKKYFRGRGGYVEMENGAMIEISARQKKDFLSKFVI